MAMDRPFRFGVSIWEAATRKEWRKKSKLPEWAGFDTLLTADHLVDGMLAPLTSLIVAAEATSRIRVDTLVLNNDFRQRPRTHHPPGGWEVARNQDKDRPGHARPFAVGSEVHPIQQHSYRPDHCC
jgi:hypothetical protein